MADDVAECYYLSISIFHMVEKLNFDCVLQQPTQLWRVLLFLKGCDAGTVTPTTFSKIGALTVPLKLKSIALGSINVVYTVVSICSSK